MNPTTDVLEKRIAALDGGVGALAVASGQSAITLALLNIAQAGDEIVSADNLYGGTYNLFHYTFAKLGIKVKFVKSNDLAAFEKAITPKTKAIYAESIGNPKLDVADLEGISKIAHENGIPLVLDNTVSPYLLRPDRPRRRHRRLFGDQVHRRPRHIHRRRHRRFREVRLDQRQVPADRRAGSRAITGSTSSKRSSRSATSPTSSRPGSPCCATWARRCRRSTPSSSCRGWRRCTCGCRGIRRTRWRSPSTWRSIRRSPGSTIRASTSSPEKASVKKYLPKGAGAIIGFGIKGGLEAGKKFIDSLELISHLANIGDAKTAGHPSGDDDASAAVRRGAAAPPA